MHSLQGVSKLIMCGSQGNLLMSVSSRSLITCASDVKGNVTILYGLNFTKNRSQLHSFTVPLLFCNIYCNIPFKTVERYHNYDTREKFKSRQKAAQSTPLSALSSTARLSRLPWQNLQRNGGLYFAPRMTLRMLSKRRSSAAVAETPRNDCLDVLWQRTDPIFHAFIRPFRVCVCVCVCVCRIKIC